MKTSNNGRQLIEKYEGLILSAYDDANDHIVAPGASSVGTLTIGYGHTSSAGGPRVVAGQTITKAQADQLLATDLVKVERQVNDLVKVPLNQNQFDALVSFHFNTGALGKSSALKKLNAKDYAGAAQALTLYTRGNGQVLQGLVRRRAEEKKLFLTPVPGNGGLIAAGTGVGGAGAVVAASHWPHWEHWLLYGGLGLLAACLAFGCYEFYKFNKVNNEKLPGQA